MKCSLPFVALFLAVCPVLPAPGADPLPARSPGEEVDSPAVCQRQHLAPDANLLFNGLGLAPAGDPVPISDLPLKIVVAPDKKAVVAVCAGFLNVGVNVVSLEPGHARQF